MTRFYLTKNPSEDVYGTLFYNAIRISLPDYNGLL